VLLPPARITRVALVARWLPFDSALILTIRTIAVAFVLVHHFVAAVALRFRAVAYLPVPVTHT